MTDYLRYESFEGQNLEESQVMGYTLMSENACDGYTTSIAMDMPASPASEMSDWSSSTTTTDCMSAPMSPSLSDEDISIKKPLKSSLKRAGASSRKRTVTWDPSVVFETRPWSGKRRRSQVYDGDDDIETEVMAGNLDAELKAPIPTKRAKLAEIETQASAVSTLQFLPSIAPPLFPEVSRTVIPSFNFNALLSKESQAETNQNSILHPLSADPSLPLPSRPSFVPFTFVTPKRNPQTSLLRH